MVKVKEIVEMPADLDQNLSKLPDMPSASYLSTSLLPHRRHLAPASSTPLEWSPHVPRSNLLQQGSDGQLYGHRSPSNYSASEGRSSPLFPVCAESSNGRSVDGWSLQSFPESGTSTHRETWSLHIDSLGSHHYNPTQIHSGRSDSHSNELKTCVVCSKYVDVYGVVAILICGHVYHADCLEHLTPEISKSDPLCPVCTLGEQKAMKMFKKLLKVEMNMKHTNFIQLARGSGPWLESSSSLRSSFARPFLKHHFSFGFKASGSSNRSFLWSKSSK